MHEIFQQGFCVYDCVKKDKWFHLKIKKALKKEGIINNRINTVLFEFKYKIIANVWFPWLLSPPSWMTLNTVCVCIIVWFCKTWVKQNVFISLDKLILLPPIQRDTSIK